MKKKKLISLLLAASLIGSMALTGCGGGGEDDGGDTADNGLPTVTFTHGYYQDESEWAPAAEMRKIYEEFAEAHKDEFNFVIKADQGGADSARMPPRGSGAAGTGRRKGKRKGGNMGMTSLSG